MKIYQWQYWFLKVKQSEDSCQNFGYTTIKLGNVIR